ncbi:MAG: hypothetical protein NTV79_01325 [Candidatus Aureabacteria bacterium]|nr:hypothetical protein [Candidatus Auribacterota bacterium]
MPPISNAIVWGLIALCLLVYAPALLNGFVNWDDPEYVVHNRWIRDGSPRLVARLLAAVGRSAGSCSN